MPSPHASCATTRHGGFQIYTGQMCHLVMPARQQLASVASKLPGAVPLKPEAAESQCHPPAGPRYAASAHPYLPIRHEAVITFVNIDVVDLQAQAYGQADRVAKTRKCSSAYAGSELRQTPRPCGLDLICLRASGLLREAIMGDSHKWLVR